MRAFVNKKVSYSPSPFQPTLQWAVREADPARPGRLEKLQESLSTEMRTAVDSLSKQLKYLSLTTHEETSKLDEEIQKAYKRNALAFDELNKTLNMKTNSLHNELEESKDELEQEIKLLRKQILAQLEKSLENLEDKKVSRADLAKILFELCLKVKGTEFVPNLKEAAENRIKADFLLPDQPEDQVN